MSVERRRGGRGVTSSLKSQRSSERPLTEKQYDRLRVLGGGAMIVSGGNKRDWESLLDRGVVSGERGAQGCFVNGIQITPHGLRLLADAVERYGWPELTLMGTRRPHRVCQRCGGTSFRWERPEGDTDAPVRGQG